jgi:hypothetical protein
MNENEKHEKGIKDTLEWAEAQGEAVKDSQAEPSAQAPTEPMDPEVVDPMDGAIPGSSVAPVFTNRMGRPTKFFPQYVEQAKVLASKGFTDLDLAQAFMVQESTINNWKTEHPDFLESIKAGKAMIDDGVEISLLQSAMGYSHPEEKVFCSEGSIVTHQTVKHYPPNAAAASLWLRNRRPDKWRDKHEIDFKVPFTINMDEDDVGTL